MGSEFCSEIFHQNDKHRTWKEHLQDIFVSGPFIIALVMHHNQNLNWIIVIMEKKMLTEKSSTGTIQLR